MLLSQTGISGWFRENSERLSPDQSRGSPSTALGTTRADPAIAFDGGWYDKEEKPELSTDQSETLAKYSEFHQSCMDIQMTMWGEVAELMEDLATAHCYCEYAKLEELESITWADKNAADIECANQGTISKKEAFIGWALPLHRQRLEDEQE